MSKDKVLAIARSSYGLSILFDLLAEINCVQQSADLRVHIVPISGHVHANYGGKSFLLFYVIMVESIGDP
jgi:hypothetical protein